MHISHKPQNYTPAPEGLHQAVCVDLVDLGILESQYGAKHKLRLYWQIEDKDPDTGKRFQLQKQYTVSLHEKAALRKDLETWRGRKFTKEELDDFDLEKLVSVNCQIQVQHNPSDDGRIFANVQAIVPLGKGQIPLRPEGYVRKKDRDDMAKVTTDVAHASVGASGQPAGKGDTYDDDVPF